MLSWLCSCHNSSCDVKQDTRETRTPLIETVLDLPFWNSQWCKCCFKLTILHRIVWVVNRNELEPRLFFSTIDRWSFTEDWLFWHLSLVTSAWGQPYHTHGSRSSMIFHAIWPQEDMTKKSTVGSKSSVPNIKAMVMTTTYCCSIPQAKT